MAPIALTIAGSDSGGGAGIQADLKTWTNLGVHGCSAITAVTAQNTLGCTHIEPLSTRAVSAQIEAVLEDLMPAVVKIGMLGSATIAQAVIEALDWGYQGPIILDPVMIASSGAALSDPATAAVIRDELCPRAELITPNLMEASALLGYAITGREQLAQAARDLWDLGPRWVLLKGGHLAGEPIDVLYDGVTLHAISAPRIVTTSTHGTGCTYAAAIAAELAYGRPMEEAVLRARTYLQSAIERAEELGGGVGPVQHLLERSAPRELMRAIAGSVIC